MSAITARDSDPGRRRRLGRAGQMGLVGMFERAEMMGGKIDLQSAIGRAPSLP